MWFQSISIYLSIFFSSFYIWLYRAWLSRDLLSCLCFVLTDYWRGSRHYGWTSIHLFSRKDEKWTMFATYRFWECLSISNHNRQSKVSIGRICDINEFSIWKAQTLKFIGFEPLYIFSRYPEEKTRLWNLVKLLTPVSWTLTFISIISAAIGLKFASYIGQHLGIRMENQELVLNPFRCIFNFENKY